MTLFDWAWNAGDGRACRLVARGGTARNLDLALPNARIHMIVPEVARDAPIGSWSGTIGARASRPAPFFSFVPAGIKVHRSI